MNLFWRIFQIILIILLIGILAGYLINWRISQAASDKIEDSITEIPFENPARIAIVFGAGVWSSGEPSPVLYDRIVTAVELYRAKRVGKILMSGDNPTENYDEPTAMKETAVKLGVPAEDVVLDFAGRRTFDTCYRAKEIFGVEKAILVSQKFHLPRAIYLCENAGIDSLAVTANRRKYLYEDNWAYREFIAVCGAWFESNFFGFEPIKGKKEPIRN